MKALIISYFGDDGLTISKRRPIHDGQLDWILEADKRIEIIVMAQHYKTSWFRTDKRITYVKSKNKMSPASARNKLLTGFYKSEPINSFALMMDNDCILYDHQDGKTVFSHMIDNPNKWKEIDLWYPIDPMREPFNYRYKEKPDIYGKYFVLEKSGVSVKGSIFVLRNSEDPVLFADRFKDHPDFISDDVEFVIENIFKRKAVYKNTNVVMKENTGSFTTLHDRAGTAERRSFVNKNSKRLLAEWWKTQGIFITDKGTFNTKAFFDKYWRHPKKVLIPKIGEAERGFSII